MGQTLTETTGIQGILNRAMPIYLQDVDGGICKKLIDDHYLATSAFRHHHGIEQEVTA